MKKKKIRCSKSKSYMSAFNFCIKNDLKILVKYILECSAEIVVK